MHVSAHTVFLQLLDGLELALLASSLATHFDAPRASILDCTDFVRVCTWLLFNSATSAYKV